MKILCINCNPDYSWITSKGLNIETDIKSIILPVFKLVYLYDIKDSNGVITKLYTPDVAGYLETNYGTSSYDGIVVGWKPSDYGSEVTNTGGYTCINPLSNGIRWMTVRQDPTPINMYPVHELMHFIGAKINIDLGDHTPKDFMDSTPVNGQWIPYYENDYNITDPNSNFNQTWKNYAPFVDRLNNMKKIQTVTLNRFRDDGVQALGDLTVGSFACKTLERPWKNNQKNVSCIPVGTYTVKWTFSLRLLRYTYEIQNVPGRTGIRIHSGNYFSDTDGCIILGTAYGDLNHDAWADILNSKVTVSSFEKFMNKKDFNLIVK